VRTFAQRAGRVSVSASVRAKLVKPLHARKATLSGTSASTARPFCATRHERVVRRAVGRVDVTASMSHRIGALTVVRRVLATGTASHRGAESTLMQHESG